MKTNEKIKIYCPICEREHEIEIITNTKTELIREELVEYEEISYCCKKSNEKFETSDLLNTNLRNLRDAYRKKINLLTTDEIIQIRKKYELTQSELSIILDLGEKTITRYETTSIQDRAYDNLLRKTRDDYNFVYDLIEKHKNKFSQNKYNKMISHIKLLISEKSNSLYNEIILKNCYINNNLENSKNGFCRLNIAKIKNIIAYFAVNIKNLFGVKLMKLLWYTDALSFQSKNKSMTGLIYYHNEFGALPKGYKNIFELDSIRLETIETNDSKFTYAISPKKEYTINFSIFTPEELNVLHKVCEKFKNYNGHELSEIMHKEDAYKKTLSGEIIDFSLVKNLRAL